ncbi:hypothetical protein JCM3765_002362 [Sporobolomyces pararoseus]
MSYPPVPYPTVNSLEQISLRVNEQAKPSQTFDESKSSTPRSSLRSSHPLSQPFKSPRRCPPRSVPNSPTPVFMTLSERSAAFLKRLMEIDNLDDRTDEGESRASSFPGIFSPFRPPQKEEKLSMKQKLDESIVGGSKDGSKRRKRKSKDNEGSENGAQTDDTTSDTNDELTAFEPLGKLASSSSSSSSSPSSLPVGTKLIRERIPFRSPRRLTSLQRPRNTKSSIHPKSRRKTSEAAQDDEESDDDLLTALDLVIRGQILPTESKEKKLQEMVSSSSLSKDQ